MVSLSKGGQVSLKKGDKPLKKLRVGLGWDSSKYSEEDFDLDAMAFMLNKAGRVRKDEDMIFYNNLCHSTGAIIHMGDNRTGDGDGDDEVIQVDLSKIPDEYEKIPIIVSIFDAARRMQNFGMISNAYIRIVDEETDEEILRYDLSEDFSMETIVVMAEIYRYKEEWKFKALGTGYSGELEDLCNSFGIQIG